MPVLEKNFLYLLKGNYGKPIANIILNGERLNTLSLISGAIQGYSLSTLYLRS